MTRGRSLLALSAVVLSGLGCEQPSVLETLDADAGPRLAVTAEPRLPVYEPGTTVMLRSSERARWTLEDADGEVVELSDGASEVEVEVVEEGRTVVTACASSRCGRAALPVAAPLEIEVDPREGFRVVTTTRLPIHATARFLSDGRPFFSHGVLPGEWYPVSQTDLERLVVEASWGPAWTSHTVDRVPTLDPGTRNAGGQLLFERSIDCAVRQAAFESLPLSSFTVDRDGVHAVVDSIEPDGNPCRSRITGTTSGELLGSNLTGTFTAFVRTDWLNIDVDASLDDPSAPRHTVRSAILNGLEDVFTSLHQRFAAAPAAALTQPLRSASGVVVTPSVVASDYGVNVSVEDVGAWSPDTPCQLNQPVLLQNAVYDAILASWWTQRRGAFGAATLGIAPLIDVIVDDDDIAHPSLVFANLTPDSVEGPTMTGRATVPLRLLADALGWEWDESGDITVWMLDGRHLDATATGLDGALYGYFRDTLTALMAEIAPLLRLAIPDPIPAWMEEFPSASLEEYVLVREPCFPTLLHGACPTVCGHWTVPDDP